MSPGPTASPVLLSLLRRVAREDREAFADLHNTLSPLVHERLRAVTPSTGITGGIVAATFIEVWWHARYHVAPDSDVVGWVTEIADRRMGDWQRDCDPVRTDLPAPQAWTVAGVESYYRHADVALAELLAPG